MKIALIRRQYSRTGGAELYLERLLGALCERNHEVHLFAEHWGDAPIGNIILHAVEVHGTRAIRPVRFAHAVNQLISREEYDCVFSLERTVAQDVYRAGDGLHQKWLSRRQQFAPWWRKPFTQFGAFHRNMQMLENQTFSKENTGLIIVNSRMVRDEIIAAYDFPLERIHFIPNGIEVNRYCYAFSNRDVARKRFGIKQDEYCLLFVGSGWERKGLPQLFKVLAKLNKIETLNKRVRLLVVGKGKRPHNIPDNVTFLGAVKDVEQVYVASDLFVFLPLYEPSANVVVEALASRLPVITTKQNGAVDWIVPGENGDIVDSPFAVDETVQYILDWINKKRPALSSASMAQMSLERNVNETMVVLESAARERRL